MNITAGGVVVPSAQIVTVGKRNRQLGEASSSIYYCHSAVLYALRLAFFPLLHEGYMHQSLETLMKL